MYFPWREALPPEVDLVLVQLPGREARIAEPPAATMQEVVDALADALPTDLPLAYFGHSLGALVAYETARRVPPLHLFASGHRAPDDPAARPPVHDASDARLDDELRRLGGTPPEVMRNAELMALVRPAFRADLALRAAYRCEPGPPLPCGISALGGRDDPDVPPESLEGWRRHARGTFETRVFDGGHFYLHEGAKGDVLRVVAERMLGFEQR